MTRVLDPERIERINQDLMLYRKSNAEVTCVVLLVILLPCLIGIALLDGPLFAKVILGGFLCVLAAVWGSLRWTRSQDLPKIDVTGLKVERLEGYFDCRWIRAGGKPYYEYSFSDYPLHLCTAASSYFQGGRQLKLNRRYRVEALYFNGLHGNDSGYYLLEESFKEVTDDSDLSIEQKRQVREREQRINQQLEVRQKRLYRLYRNPRGELEAVASGFNFAAFFLTLLWSYCAGLRRVTCLALVFLGLALLASSVDDDGHWLMLGLLVCSGVFGVFGNGWRERHLLGKGFVQVDALLSCNNDQATVDYTRKIEEAAPGFRR